MAPASQAEKSAYKFCLLVVVTVSSSLLPSPLLDTKHAWLVALSLLPGGPGQWRWTLGFPPARSLKISAVVLVQGTIQNPETR
ncbi:hypothetical protein B0J12DRAFT_669477 [Macrophomina phaseolina]|uniref:Secreted protein n=1 Tax=Macrophomina phaseolina TaxID=35725 RepID=A0ABQ8G6C5_9PEZI|nr:hypothetical protein B0J12DRAFT_669477 [Macrophomina phaseolina]